MPWFDNPTLRRGVPEVIVSGTPRLLARDEIVAPKGRDSMGLRRVMSWIVLIFAGFAEVGFTTCLKLSENFSRPGPSLGFLGLSILSFALLTRAIQTIPLGTAYAVWTGIGASGTAIVGILFFKDPLTVGRVAFLLVLIGSIIGLKMVSAS